MPETLANFRGTVRCERGTRTLTLRGMTAESPGEETTLTFSTTALSECPETLEDAVVERLTAVQYRIRSGTRELSFEAAAVHLHREIADEFYRAIPPRPAPRGKRFFWRVVLFLAASRAGLAALRMLRRKV
jgi:hypothetical protein